MISREKIVSEIEKVPEKYWEELYRIIKDFKAKADEKNESDQSVMSKLRKIRISAAPDFSIKADLYDLEGKNAD
ncbi:MAG: hypothetical protein HYR55_04630 [Acidobacteria bacterium]|nr:hypothetical protein [Acidobacteriota bacterium]MBI3657575.1 hypothetical protein [Acidobacteriota bacterium]